MSENIQHQDTVPESCLGKRFDQTLAIMFPDYSRSRLKDWIVAGQVKVNGEIWNAQSTDELHVGDLVKITKEDDENLILKVNKI